MTRHTLKELPALPAQEFYRPMNLEAVIDEMFSSTKNQGGHAEMSYAHNTPSAATKPPRQHQAVSSLQRNPEREFFRLSRNPTPSPTPKPASLTPAASASKRKPLPTGSTHHHSSSPQGSKPSLEVKKSRASRLIAPSTPPQSPAGDSTHSFSSTETYANGHDILSRFSTQQDSSQSSLSSIYSVHGECPATPRHRLSHVREALHQLSPRKRSRGLSIKKDIASALGDNKTQSQRPTPMIRKISGPSTVTSSSDPITRSTSSSWRGSFQPTRSCPEPPTSLSRPPTSSSSETRTCVNNSRQSSRRGSLCAQRHLQSSSRYPSGQASSEAPTCVNSSTESSRRPSLSGQRRVAPKSSMDLLDRVSIKMIQESHFSVDYSNPDLTRTTGQRFAEHDDILPVSYWSDSSDDELGRRRSRRPSTGSRTRRKKSGKPEDVAQKGRVAEKERARERERGKEKERAKEKQKVREKERAREKEKAQEKEKAKELERKKRTAATTRTKVANSANADPRHRQPPVQKNTAKRSRFTGWLCG